jgi:hypothetical protein
MTEVAQRICDAINAHEIDALAACFDTGIVSEQPGHQSRNFIEQLRRNWETIFASVPDLVAIFRA